jgi:hypothetical protein
VHWHSHSAASGGVTSTAAPPRLCRPTVTLEDELELRAEARHDHRRDALIDASFQIGPQVVARDAEAVVKDRQLLRRSERAAAGVVGGVPVE